MPSDKETTLSSSTIEPAFLLLVIPSLLDCTEVIIDTQGFPSKAKMARGGRAGYSSGGAVLKGKKVGCQIK